MKQLVLPNIAYRRQPLFKIAEKFNFTKFENNIHHSERNGLLHYHKQPDRYHKLKKSPGQSGKTGTFKHHLIADLKS